LARCPRWYTPRSTKDLELRFRVLLTEGGAERLELVRA
jgi:hypothetical protein